MQEENQHSLQRKQGAGVRRKETGREENYGHSFFSKNYIEVWLIFSVVLSSAALQYDSVIHIEKYILFFLVFFLWFMTGQLIYFLMLFSRTLLFIIPLCLSPPFPHTLPHDNLMSWPFLVVDEISYPLLMRKSLDTYQKRKIKPRIVLGLGNFGSHT